MKKIIFLLLSVLGIVAVAMAMNRGVEKENPIITESVASTEWFLYNGPDSSHPNYADEVVDPGNYEPAGSPPSCNSDNELCAINAEDDGGQPSEADLTALQDQILKLTAPNPNQVRFLD